MKLKLLAGLTVVGALITTLFMVHPAHAYLFGRNIGQDYYDGNNSPCYNFVFEPGGVTPWSGITKNWKTKNLNVNSFINAVGQRLYDNSWNVNRARAAAMINMMLGVKGTSPLYDGPYAQRWRNGVQVAQDNFDIWEGLVRAYDQKGWVEWNTWQTSFPGEADGFGAGEFPWSPGKHCAKQLPDILFGNLGTGGPVTLDKMIVFHIGGSSKKVFTIKDFCANMIGEENPLTPPLVFYNITGHTTVQPTALPGAIVTFRNYLNKTGPDPAHNIHWRERNPDNGSTIRDGYMNFGDDDSGDINVYNEAYQIPLTAQFGQKFCRYIDYSPAVSGHGTGTGQPACTTVVANYSLQPIVTVDSPTAQQNDQVTFTYSVNNSGPTGSLNTDCAVVGNMRPSGYAPLPQQDTARTSDPGYNPPPTGCPQLFTPGVTVLITEKVDVGNLAPGKQICRSLVVNPKNQNGGPRTSAEICVVIAKTPYVHFMGADVWAGGGFDDPATQPACNNNANIQTVAPHQLRDGSVAGSMTEYAGYALGQITNFGSASKALLGLNGKSLLFSNQNNDGKLGEFGAPKHCINNYIATYNAKPVDAPALPNVIDVHNQANGVWHLSGDRSFSGAVPVGTQQVYLVDGNVTITGDLTYPATYTGLGDIPSLVILAKGSINVMGGVGQLDGVFAAAGVFHTCDHHTDTLNVNTCNKQLVINGAVIANQLNLRRTFGADGADDTARKQPAERFSLNAELYLRNVLNGTTNGLTIRTLEQKDLPPRY